MSKNLIVSVSGVRGIVGNSLIPETIINFCSAFGDYLKAEKIVIGNDGRITGKIISNLISSTLQFKGIEIFDLGVVPTPTVQLGVEFYKAQGGISISASHNPIEWNGLKFFNKTGMYLDYEENLDFAGFVEKKANNYQVWDSFGKYNAKFDFSKYHIQKVMSLPYLYVKDIRKKKFKIVIDCVNASGSLIIPELLKEFGCEVIKINSDLTGIFPHTPEPLPQNLTELCNKVPEIKADFGIAVDPDADRLVLICENGKPFGEEYTITEVIRFLLGKKNGKVVINLSTTRAVDDVVNKYGGELIKTPVGEINVAKKMKQINALVGGEGSGGVIIPDVHYGRDSLAGIAIFLQSLTEFNGKLSELKKNLPEYYISKERLDLDTLEESESILQIFTKNYQNEKITTLDGVKIDYEDSWVIVRKSNTEPIIRIYAEARTQNEANAISHKFRSELVKLKSLSEGQ